MKFKENYTISNQKEIIKEIIKDKNPEDLLGKNGLLKQLTKALLERAVEAKVIQDSIKRKTTKNLQRKNEPQILSLYSRDF